MRRLVIYFPFEQSGTWQAGSWLRLRGYTQGLNEIIPDYVYYGYSYPMDIDVPEFVSCTIQRRWYKIMLLHNILFTNHILFSAAVLRLLIDRFSHVKEVDQFGKDILFYSHQDSSLAMYLHLTRKIPFVYDIHGIFAVQKEYTINYNWWKKLWFQLYLRHEEIVFNKAPYLNVVSKEMEEYIRSHYKVTGDILIAPDGIPAELQTYDSIVPVSLEKYKVNGQKIILFAGSCKPMGGARQLVETFMQSTELHRKAKLLLITTETRYLDGIETDAHVILLPSMPHVELVSYMKAADVIVCPDDEENEYNQICPHIKFYDALATGTPIVATDLSVNRNVIGDISYPICYFSENNTSLEEALLKAIEFKKLPLTLKDLLEKTYNYQMYGFWEQNSLKLLKK